VDICMVLVKVLFIDKIVSKYNTLVLLCLGPQPSDGEMKINLIPTPLPGFSVVPNVASTIEIIYNIPSGKQGPLNPHPGQAYSGTIRRAYLPNNDEGKYVLSLLQRAFSDQHIFTIGKSSTTGQENVVTWNDIHHKTSISGGPEQ
jgi:deltex-like protein